MQLVVGFNGFHLVVCTVALSKLFYYYQSNLLIVLLLSFRAYFVPLKLRIKTFDLIGQLVVKGPFIQPLPPPKKVFLKISQINSKTLAPESPF